MFENRRVNFHKKDRLVLLLLIFFLIIRIAIVAIAGDKEFKTTDATSYNGYAVGILQNKDWLAHPDFYGDFRAPIYPMFIAAIYAVFGINNYLLVYIFQAVISVLICFYIYRFSKRIFNEKIAVLALIWSGFYVYYLDYTRLLIRETVVFFLVIVFFYYFYLHLFDENKIARNFWLILIIYFVLIHTDPRYLFYLPFLIFLFALYKPFKQGLQNYFVFLSLTILLMIPWTVRNYIAYGGFVLINTRTIDWGNAKERNPTMPRQLRNNVLNFGDINWTLNEDYPSEEERILIKQGMNPNNRIPQEIEAIKNDVYPASGFLQRKCFQVREFWRAWRFKSEYRPFPDCRFVCWSTMHNVICILFYGLLLPFMIYGIVDLLIKKNKLIWFLLFPLSIQTLLHTLQWAKIRYRHPIDSFIIIIAFYGFYQVYTTLKFKKIFRFSRQRNSIVKTHE